MASTVCVWAHVCAHTMSSHACSRVWSAHMHRTRVEGSDSLSCWSSPSTLFGTVSHCHYVRQASCQGSALTSPWRNARVTDERYCIQLDMGSAKVLHILMKLTYVYHMTINSTLSISSKKWKSICMKMPTRAFKGGSFVTAQTGRSKHPIAMSQQRWVIAIWTNLTIE